VALVLPSGFASLPSAKDNKGKHITNKEMVAKVSEKILFIIYFL
jgi:hypothetical protein